MSSPINFFRLTTFLFEIYSLSPYKVMYGFSFRSSGLCVMKRNIFLHYLYYCTVLLPYKNNISNIILSYYFQSISILHQNSCSLFVLLFHFTRKYFEDKNYCNNKVFILASLVRSQNPKCVHLCPASLLQLIASGFWFLHRKLSQ